MLCMWVQQASKKVKQKKLSNVAVWCSLACGTRGIPHNVERTCNLPHPVSKWML